MDKSLVPLNPFGKRSRIHGNPRTIIRGTAINPDYSETKVIETVAVAIKTFYDTMSYFYSNSQGEWL